MIRYLAIGALAGFGIAYFLLSHRPEAPPPPLLEAPAPYLVPQRPHPQDLLNLQPLPERPFPQRRLAGAGEDAGR